MNKAFNRKGKLPFKTVYYGQYVTAYFVRNHDKPKKEIIMDMYGNMVEVDLACGGASLYVSDQVPETYCVNGYSELTFVEIGSVTKKTKTTN